MKFCGIDLHSNNSVVVITDGRIAAVGGASTPVPAGHKVALQPISAGDAVVKYGFAIDTFSMTEKTIKNGEVIGNILNNNGVDAQIIHNIMNDNQHIFKPSNFRVGERYTLFKSLDGKELEYLVYEPNVYHYFIFIFRYLCSEYKKKTPKSIFDFGVFDFIGSSDFQFLLLPVEYCASG